MKKKLLLFFIVILISTSNFAQTITQGAFMKKIGDFDVYANGEIFFRTMTKVEYDNLVLTKKIKASVETFTSPTQSFCESYTGYLVKILVSSGTVTRLINIGVSDGTTLVTTKFGSLPLVTTGWFTTKAYFKKEGIQVNIGLGTGTALTTFNAGILQYQLIKIIN